jgi:ribulose-phosphate 3-epimerase
LILFKEFFMLLYENYKFITKIFKMASVAPSILSADFSCLKKDIQAAESSGADWIHVDVMDGHFVPNITIGPAVVEHIRRHTTLPLDVHLMIEQPERFIDAFRKAGADIITVHQEACIHLQRTLSHIRQTGAKSGVSINPATSPETLKYILNDVDLILVMSVNPGFGGQKFIEATVSKIRAISEMINNLNILIEVDGGINDKTGKLAVDSGAHVLVAGSYIFKSDNIRETINSLKNISRKTVNL